MDLNRASALWTDYKNTPVSRVLHPGDVMYNTGPDHYYSVGESAVRLILSGLTLSWTENMGRILDLPCGHGRVARHLKVMFPAAEITYCDLDKTGVDFCKEAIGGVGVYSKPELTAVAFPNKFDLIWVGSLFTHVDRERTTRWLYYLAQQLAPHGVLVATFHGLYFREFSKTTHVGGGADWEKALAEFERTGYGYAEYTTVGPGNYGVSLSRASVIMNIATAIPGTRVVSYTERGWANNHDVLILTRNDRLTEYVAPV